jgi:GNAT superfamily N-acetyltransferase
VLDYYRLNLILLDNLTFFHYIGKPERLPFIPEVCKLTMNVPTSSSAVIRRAVPEDSPLLASLGKQAYRQHFTYLWTPEGLEAYFEIAYTPQIFRRTIEDRNALVWLLEYEEQAAGYLMYFRRKRLPAQQQEGGYLNRIYLLDHCVGKGLGRQLMQCAIDQAYRDQVPFVWLESMQSSEQTIRFYERSGFVICGDAVFTKVPMRTPELARMWYLKRDLR